ncbi:hypothetical protein RD055328_12610 [Companilactobacillus sp. RD055328]|nr:hypothetical protein RD055328_12610 [Companilactobacillus sp. RD055328]
MKVSIKKGKSDNDFPFLYSMILFAPKVFILVRLILKQCNFLTTHSIKINQIYQS